MIQNTMMNTTTRRITVDKESKRWFWDSKFAEKMEGWLFQMAWWWTDKRFPVSTQTMDNWSTNDTVSANTAPSSEEAIATPPWESWKSSDFEVVEEPKKKKAAKKTTKKKKTAKKV